MILSLSEMITEMTNRSNAGDVTGVKVRLDDWVETYVNSEPGEGSTPMLFCLVPVVIDNELAPGEFRIVT